MPHEGDITTLVTGANSGLGLSICLRLCADFLSTHPSSSHLTLIFTTRSASKSAKTLSTLQQHIAGSPRITLVPEHVDLASPRSVFALISRLPPLTVAILNAGMGAFTGIAWPLAIWRVCTSPVHAMTYPDYKQQSVGLLNTADGDGPRMAQVFAANVFGHFCIARAARPKRTVWIGSIEAYEWTFRADDVQGLRASHSYESSKRLTDVVGLTARGKEEGMFVAHPGVCATSIVELHWALAYVMVLAFYAVRVLGSPWHTVTCWKGAAAPVRIALAGEEEVEVMKGRKWGSAADWSGRESIRETEVEARKEMEGLAPGVWKELEELRGYWVDKIAAEEAGKVSVDA